ncbi:hypothetical protein V6N13_061163 [Hibiscus sabdariffa]
MSLQVHTITCSDNVTLLPPNPGKGVTTVSLQDSTSKAPLQPRKAKESTRNIVGLNCDSHKAVVIPEDFAPTMVPSNLITRTGGATSSSISPLPSLSPASHSESLDKASLATEVIACVPPDNPNTTVLFHRTSKSEHTPLGLSKVSQKTPMAL